MWITLNVTDNGKDYPIGLNTDNIIAVRPMQNLGCLIEVKQGQPVRTKELFHGVMTKIEKAHQSSIVPISMKAENEKVDMAELAETAIRNHLKFPNNPLRQTMKKLISEVIAEGSEDKAETTKEGMPIIPNTQPVKHRMTTAALG